MTLNNNRGRIFNVKWAYAPTEMGHMMACIIGDTRPLAELCADCENVERWERKDKKEGDAIYEGYVTLLNLRKEGIDTIITLCRED